MIIAVLLHRSWWMLVGALWSMLPTVVRSEDLRVTVVAVLASETLMRIDEPIAELAAEVRKRFPNLQGFRIERTTSKLVLPNQKTTFPLTDQTVLELTLHENKDGKSCLTVKPPTLGEITYICKCGKYLPIVTKYRTPDKEVLIVAIMCKPCPGTKK